MTIHQLYRNRIQAAVICAGLAIGAGVAAFVIDPLLLIPAALLSFAAIQIFRLAIESYRFDRGEIGPPECRQLVRDADDWARNGYRTTEEIAAGVPPRSRPPEPRT